MNLLQCFVTHKSSDVNTLFEVKVIRTTKYRNKWKYIKKNIYNNWCIVKFLDY